jgi:molybdate transport system substrate-binding protein
METAAREIRVFSPSAMHSSLEALAQAHRNATGDIVTLTFEIAPAFRKRLEEGQQADVVIAPPAVMDELVEIGKARADGRFELGRVGVGVVVRSGAPMPDVSSRTALERALLDAESVVYNLERDVCGEAHREAGPRRRACAQDDAPPRRTGVFHAPARGQGA